MSQLKLAFISSNDKKPLQINLGKVPKYKEFQGKFQEPLDKKLCQMILDSNNAVLTREIKSNFRNSVVSKLDKNGVLNTSWSRRHNLGRFYATDGISMTPHTKYIKHTVFSFLGWRMLDMIKSHSSIAYELYAIFCGKKALGIKNYIDNFDAIAERVIAFYSLDDDANKLTKKDVKELFNLTIYGGSLKTWLDYLEEDDPKKKKKAKKIKKEFENIIKETNLYGEMQPDYLSFYQNIDNINNQIKRDNVDMFNLTQADEFSHLFAKLKDYVQEITNDHRLPEEAALAWWFCQAALLDADDKVNIEDSISVGMGGPDLGCDIIFASKPSQIVYICQVKFREKLKVKSEDRADINLFLTLAAQIFSSNKQKFDRFIKDGNPEVKRKLKEAYKLIRQDNYKLELIYITTGKFSDELKNQAETRIDTIKEEFCLPEDNLKYLFFDGEDCCKIFEYRSK